MSNLSHRSRHATTLFFGAALLALASGCDKLKSVAGKGDDGGAGSSSSGGGILSFLGGDFEGDITMAMTTKGKAMQGAPQSLVFGIKKPKYRVEMSGMAPGNPMMAEGGALLLDPPNKKGYMLVPAKKQAVVLDFDKMKSMQNLPPVPGGRGAPAFKPSMPATPPKIDKTGKKDVVAGYECEIWKITQTDGRKADICAADGIKWIDLGDLGWSSPELTLAAVTSEANRFPLRVVSYDPAGAEELRLEATKIDKKKLDDARFDVPADYQVVDLSALFGMPGLIPTTKPPQPKTR